MRVICAGAAALAVIMVSGCDINTGPAKTEKVACNCAGAGTPPAGMRPSTAYAPPAEPTHRRWHREHAGTGYARWHGGSHSHYWRREYAELSVATYNYHSTSHSYYMSGGEGGGASDASAYAYAGAYGGGGYDDRHGDGYHTVPHGWVDGYGRAHDGGAAVDDPVHYETHGDGPHRGDPWHGYDIDCPDAARR